MLRVYIVFFSFYPLFLFLTILLAVLVGVLLLRGPVLVF